MNNPCELAHTGSPGGVLAAIALVAVAFGVVVFVAARRRGRGRALTTVGALAVLAVGATTWGLAAPGSASAATDCGPGGGSHAVLPVPSATPTDQSTDTLPGAPSGTPSDSPTDTPDDTPPDTPSDNPTETPTDDPTETPSETPDVQYVLSGTYTMDGWLLDAPDAPGSYQRSPTDFGGTSWTLPRMPRISGGAAGATVTLLSNGEVVATTITDASGNYQFTVDPGDYTVTASTLPSAGAGYWYWTADVDWQVSLVRWGRCSFEGTWTTPSANAVTVTDQTVTGVDFATTNSGGWCAGAAIEPPPVRPDCPIEE